MVHFCNVWCGCWPYCKELEMIRWVSSQGPKMPKTVKCQRQKYFRSLCLWVENWYMNFPKDKYKGNVFKRKLFSLYIKSVNNLWIIFCSHQPSKLHRKRFSNQLTVLPGHKSKLYNRDWVATLEEDSYNCSWLGISQNNIADKLLMKCNYSTGPEFDYKFRGSAWK